MPRLSYKITSVLTLFFLFLVTGPTFGWHDKTHMAISQATSYEYWYNSAGPDITKTKAGNKEATNHWFNNTAGKGVTDELVWEQVNRYGDPEDKEGHLYGAIIHSLQHYKNARAKDKYGGYHIAFCAHYIGDLSMPLHSVPYNTRRGFNDKDHHKRNDGVIEDNVMDNIERIQRNMYEIKITSEEDLAREIARIANISRQLATKLEKEDNRDLKQEEAYIQASHSASLLKAVLAYAKGNQ